MCGAHAQMPPTSPSSNRNDTSASASDERDDARHDAQANCAAAEKRDGGCRRDGCRVVDVVVDHGRSPEEEWRFATVGGRWAPSPRSTQHSAIAAVAKRCPPDPPLAAGRGIDPVHVAVAGVPYTLGKICSSARRREASSATEPKTRDVPLARRGEDCQLWGD